MVLGIGTDLVSAERMRRLLEGDRFSEVTFSEAEAAIISSRPDPLYAYSARYAGKSAVRKALRAPGDLPLSEIEILEDENGAPAVTLLGQAAAYAEARGVRRTELSLSYEQSAALAVAVAFSD